MTIARWTCPAVAVILHPPVPIQSRVQSLLPPFPARRRRFGLSLSRPGHSSSGHVSRGSVQKVLAADPGDPKCRKRKAKGQNMRTMGVDNQRTEPTDFLCTAVFCNESDQLLSCRYVHPSLVSLGYHNKVRCMYTGGSWQHNMLHVGVQVGTPHAKCTGVIIRLYTGPPTNPMWFVTAGEAPRASFAYHPPQPLPPHPTPRTSP